jgi:four helix bundle protein
MNSVEDLDVFKLAHQLALKTYLATKAFPREELFSLGDQTRRAAGVGGNGSCGYQSAAHFDVSRIPETWKFPSES